MTSYARPSYSQLHERIAADLAAMPLVLREPLSAAWARACHGEHGHLDWLYAQISPLTCDEDRLQDWAALYAVTRLAAISASGAVTVSGTVGATVPKGAALRGGNGLDYLTTEAVTLTGATAVVGVVCALAAVAGNLQAGEVLTLVVPVAGLAGTAVVGAAGLEGGADQEPTEDWRARVADEWRTVTIYGARGGRRDDYLFWALAAHPSVTGALVQTNTLGWGSIVVRPICNGLADRLPTASVMQAVAAYLALKVPAMPVLSLAQPVLRPVAVSLALAVSVDLPETRAAIGLALAALVQSKQSDLAVITPDEVASAVRTVTQRFSLLLPAADVVCGAGEIFALPSVVWG